MQALYLGKIKSNRIRNMDIKQKKKALGHRIKAYRNNKNYTQEHFCEIIGLEQPNLSNIENGKNFPDIITLFALIESGGIEPNYLLDFLREDNSSYSNLDLEILSLLINLPEKSKIHLKNFLINLKK